MTSLYKQSIDSRSPEQLWLLAHSKRFLERFTGDAEYRTAVEAGALDLTEAAALCGCEIDLWSLQPVFHRDFTHFRPGANEHDWPLTYLWDSHLSDMMRYRLSILENGSTGGVTEAFDRWRSRQIGRVQLELGPAANGLVHPPISFELSSGCSVGCWFCGISASKFKGNAGLAEGGAERWRSLLRAAQNVLGKGVEQAFCYWATEPLDNPEYPEFLAIFAEEIGVVPQTTSSIPLRNVELTRRVLTMSRECGHVPSRFSVLTTPILKRIHETFSAEELLGVELVLQNDESTLAKSRAGRARDASSVERSSRSKKVGGGGIVEATIACVSGFLVNILEGRLRLVTPTAPTDECPDGYIVQDEVLFSDSSEMEAEMKRMIRDHMPVRLPPRTSIRLAKSFEYTVKSGRSYISTNSIAIEAEVFSLVGPGLDRGNATALELTMEACERGHDPFAIVSLIRSLHQSGIVNADQF